MAQQDVPQSDFDRMRFVHHSIPNINVNQPVSLATTANFSLIVLVQSLPPVIALMYKGNVISNIQREQRKNEHVEIAMAQQDVPQSDFDRMRFVHHSSNDC
jgi:isopentenyl diphosphate isomerase/L-lactate dehydrogenase-like FMN-dependent dehydrogenase